MVFPDVEGAIYYFCKRQSLVTYLIGEDVTNVYSYLKAHPAGGIEYSVVPVYIPALNNCHEVHVKHTLLLPYSELFPPGFTPPESPPSPSLPTSLSRHFDHFQEDEAEGNNDDDEETVEGNTPSLAELERTYFNLSS